VRLLTESPRKRRLIRHVLLLTAVLVLQLCLGIASYIAKMAAANASQPLSPLIEITAAHVAVGALVLASSLVLTLQVFRYVAAPSEPSTSAAALQEGERPGSA